MTLLLLFTIFILTGLGFALAPFILSELIAPRRPKQERSTYECGSEPIDKNRLHFKISYYLFALVFIIFEVEAIYLIPWAVSFKNLGLSAFISMGIFLGILLLGLLYVIKKDILKWE